MTYETTLNEALGLDENEERSEEASTNEPAQDQEPVEAAPEEDSEQPEPLEIPKKFVGKSPQDILRAYNDLEKQFHKVSSERAEERKSKEAMENRMREIEMRLSAPPTQVAPQQRPEEEVDPLADFDEAFEQDPKEGIKKTLKQIRLEQQRKAEREQLEREAQEAQAFYVKQKAENQDFASLEPTMQQLAVEYHDLVKPNRLNSVKALKLLHLAARGASVEKYVGEAVKRAKNEGNTVRQEKKAAFSETTRSVGNDKVDFSKLSLEEMEKLLGHADE